MADDAQPVTVPRIRPWWPPRASTLLAMAFGRNHDDDDDTTLSWRARGEQHADKARKGLGTTQAPLINALLAIYAELRHQGGPRREA